MSGNVYLDSMVVLQGVNLVSHTGDNYVFTAAVNPPPPPPPSIIVPPGFSRMTSGTVGYSAGNQGNRSIDLTELSNLFGYASATQPIPASVFPYVSGAGPVIHGLQAGKCIISHFKTPAVGHFLCSWAYQNNFGGPAIDVSVSTIGGDFGDHGSSLINKINLLPTGQPSIKLYVSPGEGNANTAYLANNTDYFFNLKYHDPAAHANQLFSIWYGYPVA